MKKYIIIAAIVLLLLIFNSNQATTADSTTSNYSISKKSIDKVNSFSNYIASASSNRGIPSSRIKAHIAVESAGNPNAQGSAGEIGLMQMKAGALQDVNKRFLSNTPLKLLDLYEPGYAIAAGAAYIRILLDQLGTLDKASMAYQSGARNYNSKQASIYLEKIHTAEKYF